MNIWTSKLALICALGLTGCGTVEMPDLSFAPVLGGAKPDDRVLRSARMMNGALALRPPEGYCIDGATLTQSFALMGRCDVMLRNVDETGDESDVLTASFAVKAQGEADPTLETLTAALAPLKPNEAQQDGPLALVEITDKAVVPALDDTHWRGVMAHGPFVVGWAVYAPEGLPVTHRLIDQAAANLIEDNPSAEIAQSPKIAQASPLFSTIAGLFQ